jgi:peptide deformylase
MGSRETEVLDILEWPHPILRSPSALVTSFDEELKLHINMMLQTMYEAPGVGLAAPQIGDQRRIFVMDCGARDEQARQFVCINPELHTLRGEVESTEGCLSFPGLSVSVPRAEQLTLRAQDLEGLWFEVNLNGLEAICAQHEFDHLEGRSFLDLLGPLEKIATLQSYIEQLQTMDNPNALEVKQRAEVVMMEFVKSAIVGHGS